MRRQLDPVTDEEHRDGAHAAAWLDALGRGEPIAAPAAVVVAHPDDETIGLGLTLPRFLDLTLVHVTDGAPGDMGDARAAGFGARAAYAEARAGELELCLQALGVAPRRVGLGVRDQDAAFHLPALARALAGPLAAAELVVTHPYDGGHPDHDACAFGVQLACAALAAAGRRAPVRLEFAGYHKDPAGRLLLGFWPDPGAPEVRPPAAPEDVARKARALACHATQARIAAWFDPAVEAYRRAPVYDFTRPPPPGAAVYDDWGWPLTSDRWREAARAALDHSGPRP